MLVNKAARIIDFVVYDNIQVLLQPPSVHCKVPGDHACEGHLFRIMGRDILVRELLCFGHVGKGLAKFGGYLKEAQ